MTVKDDTFRQWRYSFANFKTGTGTLTCKFQCCFVTRAREGQFRGRAVLTQMHSKKVASARAALLGIERLDLAWNVLCGDNVDAKQQNDRNKRVCDLE